MYQNKRTTLLGIPILFVCLLVLISTNTCVKCVRLTGQENEALGKLYPLVAKSLYADHMKTKEYLIHWLRDQKLDVNKAKDKLLKSLEWRRENNIDSVLTETDDDAMRKLDKTLPFSQEGYDVAGRLVLVQEYTVWDFRKLALGGPPDKKAANRYYAKVMEAASSKVREIEKTKPGADQWILLGDLMGYNLRQHGCLSCIPLILDFVRVYENHYPDTLKHIIAVNAPRVVDTLLTLVRPLMSQATRDQFLVYTVDKETWDFVGKIIPKNELTSKYGGTRPKRVSERFP